MNEFIEEYIKNEIEKNEKRKQILSNDEYMLWLDNFTQIHRSFCDDYWQEKSGAITEEDSKNVKKLYILFETVKSYAHDNFIEPTMFSLGEYYNVKFKDDIYQIGVMVWEGTLYFCDRLKECDKTIINFEEVKNNWKIQDINVIKDKLENLSATIVDISEEVPLKAITETTNNTIKKILTKKK